MRMKYVVFPIAACTLGICGSVLADDNQAQELLNSAVSAFQAGDLDLVRSDCIAAIAAADTEQYRLSAHQVYASTLDLDGNHQAVVDYLEPVLANAVPDAESYSELVICYRTVAQAKQLQGDLSGAIATRTEAIDQYAPLTPSTIIGSLYVSNGVDCAELGDFEASRQWFERLFAEEWDYGVSKERRAINRLLAVQHCGYQPGSTEYLAMVDAMLADPRVEEDRGNALLLSEKYFAVGSSSARAVAEELFLLTNLYGWHKGTQDQPEPYIRSDDVTELVRAAIAVVLVPIAVELPPASQEDRDMNYQIGKFLLAEMADEEQVQAFRGQIAKAIRKYELKAGILGGP